ncbi:MAG: DMT family transporter [Candidatus Kariarchaeaceae archaeon]|jgi:drug/metabolite transporter (DMT)-like permease
MKVSKSIEPSHMKSQFISPGNSNYIFYILLTLTAISWGAAFPMGKIVASKLPPSTAAFYRFLIVLPLFFVITKIIDKEVMIEKKYHVNAAIFGILQVSLYNYLFFTGIGMTSSSNATLVISSGPVITAIVASLLYADEKLNSTRIIGLILAFVGVVLIVIFNPNKQSSGALLGDFIIFLAAIAFAIYTLYSRKCLKVMSPFKLTSWGTFYGVIVLFFISLTERNSPKTVDTQLIVALLYLSLVAAGFGFLMYNIGARVLGPSRVAIFINTVPMFGVITSVLILGEVFSIWHPISFALIVSGVYFVNKKT